MWDGQQTTAAAAENLHYGSLSHLQVKQWRCLHAALAAKSKLGFKINKCPTKASMSRKTFPHILPGCISFTVQTAVTDIAFFKKKKKHCKESAFIAMGCLVSFLISPGAAQLCFFSEQMVASNLKL